jgi:hypothetical protein
MEARDVVGIYRRNIVATAKIVYMGKTPSINEQEVRGGRR